ncbi:gp62 [Mycobacterium phage Omega]|uniref:Uncharacterized protein n=1 Tax=Mycobacterium phage Omega TaxID=2907835 RepID=Q854K2_BPMOM|nr:gp62 [Mycobacterium phage Omega]AAN12706.1 hypothetical protein PBI_OMEGA_62 [Mycobacterium phage Omega]
MTDARVEAWIAAWDNLNASIDTLKKCPIQDPDEYRAFCQMSADIYAHLADVPHDVGAAAAEALKAREERNREELDLIRKAFDE